MLTLLCTNNMLKALDATDVSQPRTFLADTLLGGWYLNVFKIGHYQALLFMNEKTHLSFPVVKIRQEHIDQIGQIAVNGISKFLELLNFTKGEIDLVLADYDAAIITKTNNKSLVSVMNNQLNFYKHYIALEGGLEYCDLTQLIKNANDLPQKILEWKSPLEMATQLIHTAKNRPVQSSHNES